MMAPATPPNPQQNLSKVSGPRPINQKYSVPENRVRSSLVTSVRDACNTTPGYADTAGEDPLHKANSQGLWERAACPKGKAGESAAHEGNEKNSAMTMAVSYRRLKER